MTVSNCREDAGQDHVHNPFTCPPHVAGCDCPSLDGWICNPYFVAGLCPDDDIDAASPR